METAWTMSAKYVEHRPLWSECIMVNSLTATRRSTSNQWSCLRTGVTWSFIHRLNWGLAALLLYEHVQNLAMLVCHKLAETESPSCIVWGNVLIWIPVYRAECMLYCFLKVREKLVDYTSSACVPVDGNGSTCADILTKSRGSTCYCNVTFHLDVDFPVLKPCSLLQAMWNHSFTMLPTLQVQHMCSHAASLPDTFSAKFKVFWVHTATHPTYCLHSQLQDAQHTPPIADHCTWCMQSGTFARSTEVE